MNKFYLKFGINVKSLEDYGFHYSNIFSSYDYICTIDTDTHILYDTKTRLFIMKPDINFNFSGALEVLLKMYLDKILDVY